MSNATLLLSATGIQRTLARMAQEIAERNDNGTEVVLVGVQRGGIHLADRLSRMLADIWGHPVPNGRLDVNMHRDDLNRQMPPEVHATVIPFDVTGRAVVLVDDVLFSGRTTRAALDALNDFGRPKRVQLAVLVDRGLRELPITPDFVGKAITTRPDDHVEVRLKEDGGEDAVYLRHA
ncbi:MAG: bifunctional pyr operon transcriptional regulator/uracil phosphoribosyltransferase PyrR [Verrucomicrobia bacterium]|nr:bifunctional pyr operon transcriptional regulator/uracil phosphoribosyltransferase PyrR [Verrucomicrobiota bacterium]